MEKSVNSRQHPTKLPYFLKTNQNKTQCHTNQSMSNDCLPNSYHPNKDCLQSEGLLPKAPSYHHQKKFSKLSSLLSQIDNQNSSKQASFFNCSKWKKQEHQHPKKRMNQYHHRNLAKIRNNFESQPSVGDYDVQTSPIRPKIIKDIIIKGRSKETCHKSQVSLKKLQKQNLKGETTYKIAFKAPSGSKYMKYKRSSTRCKQDEEFWKFMNSIDVKTVWKNLGKRYHFKGIKLDFIE